MIVVGIRNRSDLLNPIILYTTAALMAIVGVVCALLCVAWSIPSWRRRLATPTVVIHVLRSPKTEGLTGGSACVGSILVSIGIGACAVVALYGSYSIVSMM